MGRHSKEVRTRAGLDRRESGYYSTPPFVARYIALRASSFVAGDIRLFDPCMGAGELASPFLENENSRIFGFDVLRFDCPDGIESQIVDFLRWYHDTKSGLGIAEPLPASPNVMVANPPYNCHETDYIRSNKSWLNDAFRDVGVHNMYSMFLAAMIELATDGTIIGMITLDSFMTSRAHEPLRKLILSRCAVHEIALCPTDLFRDQGADVRTCILILQKGTQYQVAVEWLNRQSDKQQLQRALAQRTGFEQADLESIVLGDPRDRSELCLGIPSEVRTLFAGARIGERFPCITGISTGNDAKYLAREPREGFAVPFYKNPGRQRYFCEPDAFLINDYLEESKRTRSFMVRNKALLTKPGICCSSMGVAFSACYRPEGSVFGVNTNIAVDDQDLWWVLAYLNSAVASFLVRGVLMRSNMVTSGYIARLPLPSFPVDIQQRLTKLGRDAYTIAAKGQCDPSIQPQVDQIVFDSIGLSETSRATILDFCTNLVKRT